MKPAALIHRQAVATCGQRPESRLTRRPKLDAEYHRSGRTALSQINSPPIQDHLSHLTRRLDELTSGNEG